MISEDRAQSTVVIPASRTDVWEAVTEPDRLSEWFGADVVEMDLRPGGRIVFRNPDGTVRRALIEAVEPPARIAFRWLPVEQRPDGSLEQIPHTSVEMLLDETPDGTQVTVVETPMTGLRESLLVR